MKVSLKWLKEYLDFDVSLDDISSKLTMAGIELESIEVIKPIFSSVVVAEIISIKGHPDADKLVCCKVSDGLSQYDVVCGAKNMKEGDFVPFAKVGAFIGDIEIKQAKLRGVTSEGMLCSEKELNIGYDDKGIFILPDGVKVGTLVEEVFDLEDVVLDLGITPNRGDCLSVRGIARELAATFNKKCIYRKLPVFEDKDYSFKVNIDNLNFCSAYGGAIIENIKVTQSPFDLRYKLFLSGVRSINNIVDITNYILLDIGQPMHAFDLDKLNSSEINVRHAVKKEKIKTLDETVRELNKDDLVIADKSRAVAIAGVMGGYDTLVDNNTKRIFFESAAFNASSIRKTSSRLNLSSESSYRFERGTDLNAIKESLVLASDKVALYAGGNVVTVSINTNSLKIERKEITLRLKRNNDLLGVILTQEQLDEILGRIEIEKNTAGTAFYIPAYRNDLEREVDLIEEVARGYGYDNLPVNDENVDIRFQQDDVMFTFRKQVSSIMVKSGLSEAINYSFVNKGDLLSLDEVVVIPEVPYTLANPLNEELSVMRNSLLPSLIRNFVNSSKYSIVDIKLFEVGAVFPFSYNKDDDYSNQVDHLGVVLGGKIAPSFVGDEVRDVDFYDLKGIVSGFLESLNIKFSIEKIENGITSLCCNVIVNDINIGVFGEFSSQFLTGFSCKERVYFLEFDLNKLFSVFKPDFKMQEIFRMPSITEDMSFVIDKNISHQRIIDLIKKQNISILNGIRIFDIYMGKKIPEGKKSVAYSLSYQDKKETLKLEEVNKYHEAIKKELREKLDAEFR